MEVNSPYPNIPLLEAVALEEPLAVLLLRLAKDWRYAVGLVGGREIQRIRQKLRRN